MQKRLKGLSFITLLFLVSAPSVFGAERLELTLRDAVGTALRENLTIVEERTNRNISVADITVKEGEFDPAFFFQVSQSFKKGPAASVIAGTEESSVASEIGVEGKVVTGATYELKWRNDRFSNNSPFFILDPYYASELVLTVKQPLLKDAGRAVQESSLNIARNNFEISKLRLDDRAEKIIADTTRAYWDLLAARYELDVAGISLRLALDILNEVKAKISSGFLAPAEIYKAEAEAALREEALLEKTKRISDAEDNLRLIMNMNDWGKELSPAEKPPETSELPSLEAALSTAKASRKDYRQAVIDRKNREMSRRFLENQQLSDLSIFGAAGVNGLDSRLGDTLDRLVAGKSYSWQAGLLLNIPIGNRTAKGNTLRARYEEEMAEISLKALEQRITAEVREAWRSLQLAVESIEATGKTRLAAEKRLDSESVRFRVGMATLTDVLRFQEEYARAMSSEKNARISYAKAVAGLEKAKGTLWQGEAEIR